MTRGLRFAFALLVVAAVARAQTAGTGVTAPGSMADSLYYETPAPTNSLVPAAIPPVASPVPPAAHPGTPLPSRPRVLAIRTEAVLRVERDQMDALAQGAGADLAAARRARAEAHGAVERTKQAIAALGAPAKAARQTRDDAARAAVEGERKRQESVRAYFEHLQDVHDAAIDEATARGEFARAAVGACDWELRLVGRSGLAANDGDPELFKLEQQYLDAVKGRCRAEERLAARALALADRKLRLYRAWADWLGGR